MKKPVCIIIALLLSSLSALASSETVASPNGNLKITLSNESGRIFYAVRYAGTPVVEKSRLGLSFKRTGVFVADAPFKHASHTTYNETWEQPWGETRYIRNHYNELAVTFEDATHKDRVLTITFRVYDDGLGFRYDLQAPDETSLVIDSELTEFNFAQEADAWWIPAGEWNRYEYLYEKTPLTAVEMAHTPITMRTADGLHISLHEAALVDYAGMWLKNAGEMRFTAELAPNPLGGKVHAKGQVKSPWRTVQITEDAIGLLNSHLILNLNEPNKLGDVSWVKPGKYIGIWWGMHLDINTWGSGDRHGATTQNTKKYIDFAAKHGFDGVLVEGWNEGWDGNWFDNGDVFSFTKPYPDFNLQAVGAYARSKGVRLIGHHETSGGVTNYENQIDAAFSLYEKIGVRQIKTGYVANGGDIVRRDETGATIKEWHDGQYMSRHNVRLLEKAAKHKLSINSHEPIKDTGLRRTYPNWLSREGARGQEYNAWGTPGNPPSHTAILPYTRMLSGPMDFTPGIFDLLFEEEKPNNRVETTLAKQLALYVVLYSPIQMAADLPENYEARPDAFQFIRDVPTDWTESHALAGEVGEYAVFARKDRTSEDWYIGGLTNADSRSVTLDMSFLNPGRSYTARIYSDSSDADWQSNPYGFVISEKKLAAEDTLTVYMAPGGGFAVRLVPLEN